MKFSKRLMASLFLEETWELTFHQKMYVLIVYGIKIYTVYPWHGIRYFININVNQLFLAMVSLGIAYPNLLGKKGYVVVVVVMVSLGSIAI